MIYKYTANLRRKQPERQILVTNPSIPSLT